MDYESTLSGTDYVALAAANPYSGAADLYNTSRWQTFLSGWLGQRTEADAWKENMAIQEREYNAALLQKQHDEEYNNPVNQVARMRLAGINPDLQSGAVDPGSPGAMGTDMSTPMQSTGTALDDFSNVANMVLSAVTTAVGFSGDLLHLGQLRQTVDSQKLGNLSSVVDLAFNSVLNGIPSDSSFRDSPEAVNNAVSLIKDSVGSRIPRRYRKTFDENVSRFMSSLALQNQEYQNRDELASRRLSFVRKRGSRYYDDQDDVMEIVNDEMIKLTDSIAKKSLKNADRASDVESGSLDVQEKRNIKEGEYLDSVDGSLEGQAQNAENRLTMQTATMTKEINDSMSSIVHRLNSEAKKGNVLAEGVLLFFNVLRLKSMDVNPKKLFGFAK